MPLANKASFTQAFETKREIDKSGLEGQDVDLKRPGYGALEILMATMLRFSKDQYVFEPEITQAMATAFDTVCRALGLGEKAESERETVAARIIELARRGERDPARLSANVLRDAGAA